MCIINQQHDKYICRIDREKTYTIVNEKYVEDRIAHENCPVYCLTVPGEVFYVRRNGKAVWTGNSRAGGPVTILTRQAPEGKLSPSYLFKEVAGHRVWWRHIQTAGSSDF